MTRSALLLSLVLLTCAAAAKPPVIEEGIVQRVKDGDSYLVDIGERRPLEVRVAGIDTPEEVWPGRWEAQPFGEQAKAYADKRLTGKRVRIEIRDTDRYGRSVAEVFVDEQPMSQALVREGLAWWNRQYAPKDTVLKALQDEAREAHRGLWSEADPVPPWEYRKRSDRAAAAKN
jgi:endonuclease YncB( thermonuclease family)